MSRMATAHGIALQGLDGFVVGIEAAVGNGLPRTVLVGLPDAALYEARDRCRAAVASAGLEWPGTLVTINLTPAALPKAGSHYDLGIVAAVLSAGGVVPDEALGGRVFLGEVGLDGGVRAVRGLLPALLAARDAGFSRAVVPWVQTGEARLVAGMRLDPVASLGELVRVLRGETVHDPEQWRPSADGERVRAALGVKDLSDVVGQSEGRFALEVAAAGGHHLSFVGAPGAGKTMLAERLPGLLPDLSAEAALEVAAIRSLHGAALDAELDFRPPYADPHHSASLASLVGGGTRVARPGSISLAHRGVLFLDEAAEFSPKALDALRTPLESGHITLGRSAVQARYPARFQLIMASNPCPCGMALTVGATCECPPMTVRRYRTRVSGPILDRIDIRQTLQPVKASLMQAAALEEIESTALVAARVAQARDRAAVRLRGTGWRVNAEVPGPYLRRELSSWPGVSVLERAVRQGRLTARGVDKCLRLAWTLADLAGRDLPNAKDARKAIGLRDGADCAEAAA